MEWYRLLKLSETGLELQPSTSMPLTTSTTVSSSNTLFFVSHPSSPLSFHLLDNYDDPSSDIGIVYFGMWVPHPFYPLMESCYSYHDLKTI